MNLSFSPAANQPQFSPPKLNKDSSHNRNQYQYMFSDENHNYQQRQNQNYQPKPNHNYPQNSKHDYRGIKYKGNNLREQSYLQSKDRETHFQSNARDSAVQSVFGKSLEKRYLAHRSRISQMRDGHRFSPESNQQRQGPVRSHSYSKSLSTVLGQNYTPTYQQTKGGDNGRYGIEFGNCQQVHKLQSQILENQKILNNQKFQIEALTEELSFYLKTCEKNKKELQVAMTQKQVMMSEYQEQIQILLVQREKVSEIFTTVTQQYDHNIRIQESQVEKRRNINKQIAKEVDSVLSVKQNLLSEIKLLDQETEEIQYNVLKEQEDRIDQLRNIQRKFNIALKQLERLKRR